MTLALTGSPHDETEPKKATYSWADAIFNPTLPDSKSRRVLILTTV
jgi:hypothetical protein